MDDKMCKQYLSNLIGGIYKILPMFEERSPSLSQYISSLNIQLKGALSNFEALSESDEYIQIINIISYFNENNIDDVICKREVFKCIELIKKIKIQGGIYGD